MVSKEPVTRFDGPGLLRSDGMILAAVLVSDRPGQPIDLRAVLASHDHLDTTLPTFDQPTYGLARLAATVRLTLGYSSEAGVLMAATEKAAAIRRAFSSTRIRDLPVVVEKAIGARPYPEPETEDRSLGALSDLTRDDYVAADTRNREFTATWIEEQRRKPPP